MMLIGGYFRSQSERKGGSVSWKEEGLPMIITLRLAGLSAWLAILAWLFYPQAIAWAQVTLPAQVRALGFVTAIGCIPLIYNLFVSIGTNISQTAGTREGHQLVTHGIYRHIRHPLYAVGGLFFLCQALIAANALIFALVIFSGLLLHLRVPREEAALIAKFGDDYRQYMRKTGRYFPKINITR